MVKSKLAELRRQHTPATATVREGIVIPDTILALDREALLARLENLRQAGAVRYSHQELIGLSDSDLRGMLALLVSPTER
jgi:hypothetical protein